MECLYDSMSGAYEWYLEYYFPEAFIFILKSIYIDVFLCWNNFRFVRMIVY